MYSDGSRRNCKAFCNKAELERLALSPYLKTPNTNTLNVPPQETAKVEESKGEAVRKGAGIHVPTLLG